MITKITSKNRITIPKAIRQHLNVGPGDRIEFAIMKNGTVKVHPVRDITELKGMIDTGDIHLSDEQIIDWCKTSSI